MRATRAWGPVATLAVVCLVTVLGAVAVAAVISAPLPGSSSSVSPGFSSPAAVASPAPPDSPAHPSAASSSPASPNAPTPAPQSFGHSGPGAPDPRLTPGVANAAVTPATIARTICARGWTATIRPPASYTTALKRQQIAEYGYADKALAHYEEDHLISLELGGDPRDPANLWPEPYTARLADGTPVGARVKDLLENRLNDLVCSGDMPLATAQHLIATDWIGAWLRYVAP
jgi:hypothetical protein